MSLTPATPRCVNCSAALGPNSTICTQCGYVQSVDNSPGALRTVAAMPAPTHPGTPVPVVAAKSPGIAIALSIWLGVGHLYAGRTATGIAFLIFHGLLVLVSIIPFMLFLTVPAWAIGFAGAATGANRAAKEFNRRNGIVMN